MRLWYGLGAVVCVLLVGFAIYSQFYMGLKPCPLCIFQRIAFMALGLVFAIAALHNPKQWGRYVYAVLASVAACVGVGIAGRHTWLTVAPKPAGAFSSCGADLGFIMETFPLWDAVKKVFTGSGDCSKSDWAFLGLNMPSWSLLWFVVLLGVAIVGVVKRPKSVTLN